MYIMLTLIKWLQNKMGYLDLCTITMVVFQVYFLFFFNILQNNYAKIN